MVPLSVLMDHHCDELAFPKIWFGQARKCNPNIKLSLNDHYSIEIRRSDRRCARPDYLLYIDRKCRIKQLYSQMNIMFRKSGQGMGITAQQAMNNTFINDFVKRDNGYRFTASIIGTPAYWENEKKRVCAMVRQFNYFTMFVTVSAAETHWTELLIILKKNVDKQDVNEEDIANLDFSEKARLIRTDPVTCTLYFDHRFKELMKTWKAHDGPFGEHKVAL